MKTTIILFAFLASAICQSFPSSSQTWTPSQGNERVINITGAESLKYPIGNINMAINIEAGSGVLYYGVGDHKHNLTASGSSMLTYEMAVPFCTLDDSPPSGMSYFVYLESTVDLSYTITLTQSSTEIPNNETRTVNLLPGLFKGIPFLISTGDKDVSKTIDISIISGVPLGGYMDVAVLEARQNCATESLQLQSFPVVANSTTWAFTAQFDAGYENYTITFVPSEKQTVFSSFYITATTKLGAKPGLGKWLYLIIGGAATVMIVAIIAVILYVRRPKGYVRIQANY